MKIKRFLLPLSMSIILCGCSNLVPVGDGSYKNNSNNPVEEFIYESVWDFTNLNFGGNLNNATPKSNLLTYCNSRQTSNIVTGIVSDGCFIEDINTTSSSIKDSRLVVGNNESNSLIEFDFNVTIKYVEIYAESYHNINNEGVISNINKNSAIHVRLKEQFIDLSSSEDKVSQKSQKFTYNIEKLNYFSIYTNSSTEKVLINKIIVGYTQIENSWY